MRRVLKPNGILAAREVDMSICQWYPEPPAFNKWLEVYMQVARANSGDPIAGRRIHAFAHEAGFERDRISVSASTWCFTSQEERKFWGTMWADRLLQSAFFQQAVNGGHASGEELHQISRAWRDWCDEPDGRFVVVHGEILCRKL